MAIRSRFRKQAAADPPHTPKRFISADLEQNLQMLTSEFEGSSDLVTRSFVSRAFAPRRMAVVFIDGIVDSNKVNMYIIEPLLNPRFVEQPYETEEDEPIGDMFRLLTDQTILMADISEVNSLDVIIERLLNGQAIVFMDKCDRALSANTVGGEKRGVEEPSSQTVVRGPKEGFSENVKTNLSLIRRRIRSPNLMSETMKIGRQTQTNVMIVYLKGTAKDEVVQEIRSRLKRIDTNSILESGYIEEFIQDSPFSPFPTIQNTERPDAAAAGVLAGQIAIIVDGTPFVLLAPTSFFLFFQSSEDYYQRFDISTFLRILRFVSYFVSLLLPALYISITTFHQEMLPTPLLISLAAQREVIPFPAIFEALLMELTFEVLREAGVRMPRAIGPAISIVGALVLGQAAVQAGLFSAGMVIVVSFTAISNFVLPAINMSISARLLRFAMMILSGTFGLIGIMSGLLILLIHLLSLRSIGVPYLTPISPFNLSDMKDLIIRFPIWSIKLRPSLIASPRNRRMQGANQKPEPPKKNDNGQGGTA